MHRGVRLGTKKGRTSDLRFGSSQAANPINLVRTGSMSGSYALRHAPKNVLKNLMCSVHPEESVDMCGAADLLRGHLDPRRMLSLG